MLLLCVFITYNLSALCLVVLCISSILFFWFIVFVYFIFLFFFFFFFKQNTAYDVRISDWSSDVCSSDLASSAMKPAGLSSRQPCHSQRARPDSSNIQPRHHAHSEASVSSSISTPRPTMIWKPQNTGATGGRSSAGKIGRAPCRVRVGKDVEISGVAGSLKKKKQNN